MESRVASSARSSLLLAALASVAACGEPAKPAAAPAPPASAAVAPIAPSDAGPATASLPPGVPDTAAGHQLAWVLAQIAQPPSEADVTPRFAPDFTAQVPPAQIVTVFGQLGALLSPLTLDHVEAGPTATSLFAVVRTDKPGNPAGSGPKMRISLRVEDAEPHRILGLLVQPETAASWDEVQSGLKAVAPSVAFLAAEIAGGKCAPISAIEPQKPLAIGSAFKLYVLDALAKQVAAGKHKWDDTIAISDAKKSLPSGDMRNEPAGKTFTVRQFAEKMISVSDNTATDHLLSFVGRTAVEDAVKTSGHATPSRNVPIMSTRDIFALKLLGTPEELKAYVAADVAHKRKTLEDFEKRDLSKANEDQSFVKPRLIDSLEWFASPEDLCKVMVSLKGYADAPATAPVGAILSINPGIPDARGAYKYIGFKGGSEPGVMNLTWLLERNDGKWVFLSASFNDPGDAIDETKAALAASAARDFLGR